MVLRNTPHFGRLVYRLARDPRVSRGDKALLAAAAAYAVTPYDLIPDWIPVLGQLDDLFVLGIALHRLISGAGIDLLLEHWEGEGAALEALLDVLDRVNGFLTPTPVPLAR